MQIATLKGTGALVAGGDRYESVSYELVVTSDGRFRSGDGFLTGLSFDGGMAGTSSQTVVLYLDGGDAVTIVITGYNPGTGLAQIKTSGPIPGF